MVCLQKGYVDGFQKTSIIFGIPYPTRQKKIPFSCASSFLQLTYMVCYFQASGYYFPFTDFRSILAHGDKYSTSKGQVLTFHIFLFVRLPTLKLFNEMFTYFSTPFRLHHDIKHILGCIRSLPTDNVSESGTPNWGQLDEFLAQRFGAEAG